MENSRSQLLERLQTANNILVTVSANPSVDQLSAAIGLTLMLNKVGKQGTAVFSGKVPSTIEFLQPEKTIEKNTDSLRDFIIALDKSKADKLRYKVEDSHVKIFITPYRTAISEKDLQFSQGDFNVEVVIALGVKDQKDLDRAITAHGRILHDATTISVTNGEPGTVGSIDWDDPKASSLSEMVASLANDLGADSLDSQIATAFMTGIVAQTERFRNARTAPSTMSIASALMAAGANQQLIATKLEQQVAIEPEQEEVAADLPEDETATSDDANALRIEHEDNEPTIDEETPFSDTLPEPGIASAEEPQTEELTLDEMPESPTEPTQEGNQSSSDIVGGGSLILDPPTLGGKLSANTEPEHLDPPIDALGVKDNQPPILQRQEATVEEPSLPSDLPPPVASEPAASAVTTPVPQEPETQPMPVPEPEAPAIPEDTKPVVPDVSDARDAVSDALSSLGEPQRPLPPIDALNAQPFDINDQLGSTNDQPTANQDFFTMPPTEPQQPLTQQQPQPPAPTPVAEQTPAFKMPDNLVPPAQPAVDATAAPAETPAAPPVPPPFMPNVPGFDPGAVPPAPQPDNGSQSPTNPTS